MKVPSNLDSIDYQGFAREIAALRAEIDAEIGPSDVEHLRKIERWGRLCTAAGYATAWLAPNPISAALIAVGSTTRWTVMMHHVGHRGMDRAVDRAREVGVDTPAHYASKVFATGRRRFIDWLDWMLPEAWHHEHDVVHHYSTNEVLDPDLVEENLKVMRASDMPRALKYGAVAFFAFTWKFSYYAPNTFQVLKRGERTRAARRDGSIGPTDRLPGEDRLVDAFDPRTADGREFWRKCLLPYGLARFVAAPALFSPLGPWAVASVALNSIGAELLTNAHTFAIITPNHAGDDVYRFEGPVRDRAEHYVRQVAGSVNYDGGTDVSDWLQGYLNYQIEHHLWPDLPPLKYRQYAPRVREICARYGVPYVQEGLAKRFAKMVDVMVGKTSMKTGATLSRAERQSLANAAE